MPTIPTTSNSNGPTLPIIAPKAIKIEATEYEAAVKFFSFIKLFKRKILKI